MTKEAALSGFAKWRRDIADSIYEEISAMMSGRYPAVQTAPEPMLQIQNRRQHTGETTVYVDRSNKKYHSKPNCSGMKNPKSIPLSQAKKKYTACKKCCK